MSKVDFDLVAPPVEVLFVFAAVEDDNVMLLLFVVAAEEENETAVVGRGQSSAVFVIQSRQQLVLPQADRKYRTTTTGTGPFARIDHHVARAK